MLTSELQVLMMMVRVFVLLVYSQLASETKTCDKGCNLSIFGVDVFVSSDNAISSEKK